MLANKFTLLEYNTNLTDLRLIKYSLVGMNFVLPCIARALQKNKSLKLFKSLCITSSSISLSDALGAYSVSSSNYMALCEYDIGANSIKTLLEMLLMNETLTT